MSLVSLYIVAFAKVRRNFILQRCGVHEWTLRGVDKICWDRGNGALASFNRHLRAVGMVRLGGTYIAILSNLVFALCIALLRLA